MTLLCLLIASGAIAQERTESGYLMNWSGDLRVEPGTITNGRWSLNGHTITIHEADAKTALDLWKQEYKAQGATIAGSNPAKATNVSIAGISSTPLLVLATVTTGSTKGDARLTLAYCASDSTNVDGTVNVESLMHDLAVKLNRAVVQRQIDEQQEVVDRYVGKVEDAQRDQAKAQKRAADANDDLEKAKKEKSKLSARQAEIQSDIQKYQERYNRTQSPADLKKLTKAQQDLVDVQKDMSKQMKKEADAQKDANAQQGDLPDAQEDQNKYQSAKEKATIELEALKRKLEAVR